MAVTVFGQNDLATFSGRVHRTLRKTPKAHPLYIQQHPFLTHSSFSLDGGHENARRLWFVWQKNENALSCLWQGRAFFYDRQAGRPAGLVFMGVDQNR